MLPYLCCWLQQLLAAGKASRHIMCMLNLICVCCTEVVQHRYNTGVIQVQYRYKSVTIQVQHRYHLGTIQARYRYNTGSVNCNTGTTKDAGGALWYIVQWTNVRTQHHCQQKAIYLYSLPICFCSLSTLALHTPSLSQVEKRPTILQIKLPLMHFKQCKNRFLVFTSVPGAWTEPDIGT